ncbi:MAG TPA: TetR/AcrR family transcriptional regulator [Solirubrobacterales bacterium]|jgi:AcrR family transcriptional regulator|nr:TetR/AcrR family transcriptional regulator [Solirubrobacterales bacterium]
MSPEEIAAHQRLRLQGAMVEAVARHGYAGTTLRELVALAGVSRSTFYENFENKQALFLATFEAIVAELEVRVGSAYRSGGDFRDRLTRGLGAFMDLAVEEPAAASLAAIDSLTLGAAGVAHRERAAEGFEALVGQSFEHSPTERQVAPTTVRAIVAGIRGVTYRRLRAGLAAELPGTVGELVDWALGFQASESEATRRAVAAAEVPRGRAGAAEEQGLSWEEPPDSRLSRRGLSQRERIVRGAARVVVEKGYEALSIPAISGAAGTSNQTFYEHFASKRDAFLAAFEILSTEALTRTVGAYEEETRKPEAVGAGLRALLEYIGSNELFAQLAFFELPTAGPPALDQAEATFDLFTAYLRDSPELGAPLPGAVIEAVPSAIWAVIQHEIAQGRLASLPEIAPEVTRIVVASFGPT